MGAASVHVLRDIAATNAIAAGADVTLVQQMLGHKNATETLLEKAARGAAELAAA